MNTLENNKQMQVDCVQPDNILQICRQARLETAQTTSGKAGQKTTSPSDQKRRVQDSQSLETEKDGATGKPRGRKRGKTTVTKEHHRDTMETL